MQRAAAGVLAAATLALAGPAVAQPGASATVERRQVDDVYAADAIVESVRQATVSAQISGQLTQLLVDAGDRVKRGQLLARIDTREADAQVASAGAQAARAEAALAQAKLEHERQKSLVAQGFVSQAALDRAEAELKTARAALDAARAGSTQAATGRSYAELRAPIDGVVTRRLMEPGELAAPGRAVVEIHDPAALRAVGTIPQFVLPRTARVERAEIELPALQRRLKAARVTVLPAADPRLLSTQVRAELPAEAPAGIVPGTAAKVLVPIGRSEKLVVPAAAVVRRSELTAVYVLTDGGGRQLRQVRVGNRVGDDMVEVLAGLSAGERVALDPLAGRGAI
ncbi:MAG: efflux RND transporter periplasmic adaptor subunit [Burkholderiaceae bacterium]|jgi:RND family efflux transporter MFP subunit|nr:efflux RND transporter periplasmic adaptor subunit [Burkholderiaceae bacterium]